VSQENTDVDLDEIEESLSTEDERESRWGWG